VKGFEIQQEQVTGWKLNNRLGRRWGVSPSQKVINQSINCPPVSAFKKT
jgi:hypothetical protein